MKVKFETDFFFCEKSIFYFIFVIFLLFSSLFPSKNEKSKFSYRPVEKLSKASQKYEKNYDSKIEVGLASSFSNPFIFYYSSRELLFRLECVFQKYLYFRAVKVYKCLVTFFFESEIYRR